MANLFLSIVPPSDIQRAEMNPISPLDALISFFYFGRFAVRHRANYHTNGNILFIVAEQKITITFLSCVYCCGGENKI
jgi:hypothetical protein